jgi:hypothetical protein
MAPTRAEAITKLQKLVALSDIRKGRHGGGLLESQKMRVEEHESGHSNSTSADMDVTPEHWVDRLMRQRLRKFLPIVLIALAVQLLAPIAACWAAALAASDPLGAIEICHSDPAAPSGSTDPHAQDRACSICCLAQSQASFDAPQPVAFSIPHVDATPVIWHDHARAVQRPRSRSNAQARAPPQSA